MIRQAVDYFRPVRRLERELRAFAVRDKRDEAARRQNRQEALLAAMRRAHPRRPIAELQNIAQQKAQLEEFCAWRLFLPRTGLEELMPELLLLGFVFLPYDEQLVATLFPDEWKVSPLTQQNFSVSHPTQAILLTPAAMLWARLTYCSGEGVTRIWR
ncbi:MAG TPA: hypothetical protein VFZ48_02290 [Candidatus Saccharimonadales bacterium]